MATVHTNGGTKNDRPGPARRLSPLMMLLIGGGIVLVLGIVLYYAGLSQGRAELAAQKAGYEKQLGDSRTVLGQAQTEAASLQTQNRLLAARGDLYRAAVALDRRNFGIANDTVQQAAKTLQPIQAAEMGGNFSRLETLRQGLSGTNIQVAADLETQRSQLIDLAKQMDGLLPPP